MESTGNYWMSPYDALEEAGLPISIVNPAHVKGIPGRKTDISDACSLADRGLSGQYKPSYIPPLEFRHLRAVERNLTKQTETLQTYKNRETKFFVTAGYRLSVFSDEFGKTAMTAKQAILDGKTPEEVLACVMAEKGSKRIRASREELLESFQGNLTIHLKKAIESNRRLYSCLEKEIKMNREYIISEIKRLDGKNYKFLQTIPGISELSAAIILIEIGGGDNFIKAFQRGDSFAAWLGLCPGNNDSNSKRTGKKGRHGDRYLRWILCEVAQAAVKTKGTTFRSKFQSLIIWRSYKCYIVPIAHKIAKMIHYVILHQRPYKDPQIDYQALSCKRNRSRWIKKLMECEDIEITVTNTVTGEVYNSQTFKNFQQIGQKVNIRKIMCE